MIVTTVARHAIVWQLALGLAACGCLQVCQSPPGSSDTTQSFKAPLPRLNMAVSQARPKTAVVPLVADPLSLTVGAIIGGIRSIIQDLSNLVDTTSGDIKSVVIQTQQSAEQLAADLDARFKNNLGAAVRDLNNQDQQIAVQAYNAMNSMRAAIDQAHAAADETALTAMQDASIATYSALYNLPCRERIPRAVYITPRSVRMWSDPGAPGEGANKQSLQFTIRGNYLESFGIPKVSIGGKPVTVSGYQQDEIYIAFTDEIVQQLLSLTQASQVIINTSLTKCQGGQESSDVALLVKPPINYAISAKITPTVLIPSASTKDYAFFETGGCDSNYRADHSWPVDAGTNVTDCKVNVNSANCGSNIISVVPSGSACFVSANITGCGKDCFLGYCNCRGRGWLGYNVKINYQGMRQQILPTYEVPPITQGGATSYVFPYAPGLPPDRDTTQTVCDYYIRILVTEGQATHVVELTNNSAPPQGFLVGFDPDACKVSLTIQPPTALAF